MDKRVKALEMFHNWQTGNEEVTQSEIMYFCYNNDLNYDDIENEYWDNDYEEKALWCEAPWQAHFKKIK